MCAQSPTASALQIPLSSGPPPVVNPMRGTFGRAETLTPARPARADKGGSNTFLGPGAAAETLLLTRAWGGNRGPPCPANGLAPSTYTVHPNPIGVFNIPPVIHTAGRVPFFLFSHPRTHPPRSPTPDPPLLGPSPTCGTCLPTNELSACLPFYRFGQTNCLVLCDLCPDTAWPTVAPSTSAPTPSCDDDQPGLCPALTQNDACETNPIVRANCRATCDNVRLPAPVHPRTCP